MSDEAQDQTDRAPEALGAADENAALAAEDDSLLEGKAPSAAPEGEAWAPDEPARADQADRPDDEQRLRALLADAERGRDEYLDHLRRERAEFENYRRRTAKERMDALDRGAEQVLTRLLDVLDNFRFALDAAENSDDDRLAKGVKMVHDQLVDVLRQAGMEEIPAVGQPFDPVEHEAMLSEEAEEPLDDPLVTEVLRAGYRFKGRVLRPASVKVAR